MAWWLRRPSWQFQVILPNQILFWVVIAVGYVGPATFEDNFATCITWYVWFTLVFLLILATGRGWCAVCPFGGLAEWIQRGRLWHGRGQRRESVLRNRHVPGWLANHGYVTTAVMFAVLTWIEEYFAVADTAPPWATSVTVIGIIAFALIAFLSFGRRAFCRYLCPLGGLIGVLGAGAPVRGFHARDPRVCRACTDKECLRGSDRAYGCPWGTWPGGTSSNVDCGLCGECFRSCSRNNIGLYVRAPLSGMIHARDRRADVAWTAAIIGAVMIHQHVHAAQWWKGVNDQVNGWTGMSGSPNPLFYVLLVAAYTLVLVSPVALAGRFLYRRPAGGLPRRGDSFLYRTSPFRAFFLPSFAALTPLLAVDFLTVDLLGFVQDSPKMVRAAARMVGVATPQTDSWSDTQLLGDPATVNLQVALLVLGGLASLVAFWRIADREIAPVARSPWLAKAGGCLLLMAGTAALITWYVVRQGDVG